jgi:hypothetical protein
MRQILAREGENTFAAAQRAQDKKHFSSFLYHPFLPKGFLLLSFLLGVYFIIIISIQRANTLLCDVSATREIK